jgi:hypothetical protein
MDACRCGDELVMRGPEARRYASDHLALSPVPTWAGEDIATDYGVDGWSEWRCPDTAARWHGNSWKGGFELRRRPTTLPSDYTEPGTIRVRAAEVNDAHAEINRWFRVDEERWRAATERFWRAMEAMYSPDWHELVESLRHGDQRAVQAAVVFLDVDAHCHRSGYEKERLCRYLARIPLEPDVRQHVFHLAQGKGDDTARPGRERKAWQKLAAATEGPTSEHDAP